MPVYKLLGGPTRDRIRVYKRMRRRHAEEAVGSAKDAGRQGLHRVQDRRRRRHARPASSRHPALSSTRRERFAALREAAGNEVDIAIDFHGAISPQTAKLLIKALEPYQPMFIEEPVQCQNVDVMADIAAQDPPAHRHRRAHLHQVGLPRDPREARRHDPAAGHLPRRRHHRGAPHRRHGRSLLRRHRAAQPARPDLAGRRHPARRLHPQLPGPGTRRPWARAISSSPFVVKDGYLDLPTGPGLGIELDEEAMADKIGHDWRNPETYDPDDGAAIDW